MTRWSDNILLLLDSDDSLRSFANNMIQSGAGGVRLHITLFDKRGFEIFRHNIKRGKTRFFDYAMPRLRKGH